MDWLDSLLSVDEAYHPDDNEHLFIEMSLRNVSSSRFYQTGHVAQMISTVTAGTAKLVACNELLRHPRSIVRDYSYTNKVLLTACGAIHRVEDQLAWAYRTSADLYRRVVNDRYDDLMKLAYEHRVAEDWKAMLSCYRHVRRVNPSINKVTKKIGSVGTGDSSYGRYCRFLQRYYDRHIVVCGASAHSDFMITGNVSYYQIGETFNPVDFDPPPGGGLYIMLYGGNSGEGLMLTKDYERFLLDWSRDHVVLARVMKFGLFRDQMVTDFGMGKPHNEEMFVLLDRWVGLSESVEDAELGYECFQANAERLRMARSRIYFWSSFRGNLGLDNVRSYRDRQVGHPTFKKKIVSIVSGLIKYQRNAKQWTDYCFDRDFLATHGGIEIKIDMPCVMLDVGHLATDPDRLMSSFFEKCEMEYDQDLGWVALSVLQNK